jgi:hypothetical protein
MAEAKGDRGEDMGEWGGDKYRENFPDKCQTEFNQQLRACYMGTQVHSGENTGKGTNPRKNLRQVPVISWYHRRKEKIGVGI